MDRISDASLRTYERQSSMSRGRWYVIFGLFLIVTLLATTTSNSTPPASATADEEAQFVAALNQVRAGVGLPALAVNTQLVGLARQHTQVMADAGHIFHANPISAGFTGPWAKLGENVGVGGSVPVLVDAFVASPGHYANIVDPAFTEIGVGVVWSGNAMYTTHRFLQLPATPTVTVPATTAPPTTAPPITSPPTTAPPVTAPPTTAPPITAPPVTTSAPPVTTTTSPPTTTTAVTTSPPTTSTPLLLPPPQVLPERIVELVRMVELVGT